MMIQTTNPEEAKKLLKTEKSPRIIKAVNDSFNRTLLEYGKFDILLSPESGDRQDTLRGINSGLNEILGRIATKNKISIGLDLEELCSLQKMQKAQRLSKIRQNIKLCRKTGAKLALIGVKDKRDAKSLLLSLGASTVQIKEVLFV